MTSKKLFEGMTIDVNGANAFVAKKNLKLIEVDVPVIRGNAGVAISPLLSKTKPSVSSSDDDMESLTVRFQNARTEVIEAKASKDGLNRSFLSAFRR